MGFMSHWHVIITGRQLLKFSGSRDWLPCLVRLKPFLSSYLCTVKKLSWLVRFDLISINLHSFFFFFLWGRGNQGIVVCKKSKCQINLKAIKNHHKEYFHHQHWKIDLCWKTTYLRIFKEFEPLLHSPFHQYLGLFIKMDSATFLNN